MPFDADPVANGLAADALSLLGINVTLWLASLGLGKTWPVDFIWSSWPLVQCLVIVRRAPGGGSFERRVGVCALVALWGARLTLNFVLRGGVGHEDWRYTAMRSQFGRHFWWVSLFSVFLGQSLFMFAACLPLYGAMLSPAAPALAGADLLGAAACAGGILLELVADRQMDAFQAEKAAHRTDASVIERGLWLWSRHPNYCGEMAWWWGVWLLGGGPASAPVWVLGGPCGITLLFATISVQLLEQRQLENKGGAFRAYMCRVPSSLLPIPPALSRWLAGARA